MSAGRIDAPDGFSAGAGSTWGAEPDSGNGNAMGAGRRISASRPTRVVGTLDHPVTPMAIVSPRGASEVK